MSLFDLQEETATYIYNGARTFVLLSAIVGVLASILSFWAGGIKDKYGEKAKRELDANIANARKDAALANESAAQLEKEAADAKLALAKLQQTTSTVIELTGLKPNFETPETLRAQSSMRPLGERFLMDFDFTFMAGKIGGKPIRISGLRVRLVNVGHIEEGRMRGFWSFGTNEMKVPLKISPYDNGATYDERVVNVPFMTEVSLSCLIRPNADVEWITIEEMKANWTPINLHLVIDGVEFDFHWDEAAVAQRLAALEHMLK